LVWEKEKGFVTKRPGGYRAARFEGSKKPLEKGKKRGLAKDSAMERVTRGGAGILAARGEFQGPRNQRRREKTGRGDKKGVLELRPRADKGKVPPGT